MAQGKAITWLRVSGIIERRAARERGGWCREREIEDERDPYTARERERERDIEKEKERESARERERGGVQTSMSFSKDVTATVFASARMSLFLDDTWWCPFKFLSFPLIFPPFSSCILDFSSLCFGVLMF